MCGIGGIINNGERILDLAEGARLISQTLRHRGPDDEGFLFFNNDKNVCAFGDDTQKRSIDNPFPFSAKKPVGDIEKDLSAVFVHRRLAIIDVNEGGHQPMCTHDSKVWITYNGEIYNYIELRAELENKGYKFYTQSDTEVLLNAYLHWGNECLQKLNGMFAFALWDKEKKKIFCARDRGGVKPFYYYFKDGIFCFASELKALRKLPFVDTSLNERALHHYLLYDALEYEAEGFLKNVFELFPGHYLELDLPANSLAVKKYFEVTVNEKFVPFNQTDFSICKEETETLITDAIRKRLRADVPVGCCLSGGIDSSVISGVIAGNNANFNAFTATFPNEPIDESAFAKAVVDRTHARWHCISPNEDELLADFENLIYALDIPIWSTSTYAQYRVMQLAKQNNIKVVLDGQGGDELFGGYPHHFTTYVNELLRNKQFKQAATEIKNIGNNFWLQYTKENAKRKLHHNSNKKYLDQSFVKAHTAPKGLRDNFGSLNEHLNYDFFGGRLKTYLRCEDRCSMWHSVESRTPFADDTALLEASFNMPSSYKIKNGAGKYILRESMKEYLPDLVYHRRDKMGFVTPHNKWLPSLLKKYPDMAQNPHLQGFFNKRFFVEIDHLSAKNDQLPNTILRKEESLTFKALVFSLWAGAFGF